MSGLLEGEGRTLHSPGAGQEAVREEEEESPAVDAAVDAAASPADTRAAEDSLVEDTQAAESTLAVANSRAAEGTPAVE